MNSTFRARWLASSEVISQVLFTSEQPKKNKMGFVHYSACVVYTKTIIHLSVGESGGYLPPLRWIIVNNNNNNNNSNNNINNNNYYNNNNNNNNNNSNSNSSCNSKGQ